MRKFYIVTVVVGCAFGVVLADTYEGRVDTIGGTTYDYQVIGPIKRVLCNSPDSRLVAIWMFSAQESPFNDRNIRYNYYDYNQRTWNWIDPNFMNSGMNIYTERSGFGNGGVRSDTAIAVTHQRPSGQAIRPVLAGEGLGFCSGPSGYFYPVMAVGGNGWIHIAMTEEATYEKVFYSRCTTWCSWSAPVLIGEALWPTYNISASPVSDNVVIVWVKSRAVPVRVDSLFYCLSSDGGTTWSGPTFLPAPAAFGTDTITSFSGFGPFPYYDKNDQLHIVVPVVPVVRDTIRSTPAGIYHWCETNTPQWSLVRRAGCAEENLQGLLGASYVGYPSIGEDSKGNLYVTWEELDSLNIEPVTHYLRAGIWLAGSTDNGQTWLSPLRLTPPNTVSHRFPCVADLMISGDELDTVAVVYMMDSIAGCYVNNQGPVSNNPVVCQFLTVDLSGVGEEQKPVKNQEQMATIVRGILRWETVFSPRSSVSLLDVSSRKVLDLVSGQNDVRHLPPGVYFIRPGSSVECDASGVQKVIITR